MTEGVRITASLAECRELYKVSGWDGTAWSWYCDEERDDDPAMNISEPASIVGGVGYYDHKYPAYDLGYLTAMMPPFSLTKHGNGDHTARWSDYSDGRFIERWSRTNPANAVVRLALALYEGGVLMGKAEARRSKSNG